MTRHVLPAACALLLFACSDDAPGDGADAAGADAGGGPVSVQVFDPFGDGELLAGAHVLGHGPDGTLLGRATTGADGRAAVAMVPGGSITVLSLYADDNGFADRDAFFTTVLEVAPGELITVGRVDRFAQTFDGQMTITVPPQDEADYFIAEGACVLGGSGVAGDISAYTTARCPDTTELLATARREGTTPDFYLIAEDVPVGGSFTFDGPWVAAGELDFSLTGIPDALEEVALDRTIFTRGVPYHADRARLTDLPAGNFAVSIPYPAGAGEAAVVTAELRRPGTEAYQRLLQAEAGFDVSFAVGALELPWWDGMPATDGDAITWSTSGGAATADTTIVTIVGIEDLPPSKAGPVGRVAVHQVLMPGAPTSVTLPALPEDLDPYWRWITGEGAEAEVDMLGFGFLFATPDGYAEAHTDLAAYADVDLEGLARSLESGEALSVSANMLQPEQN